MESIRQAVERARADKGSPRTPAVAEGPIASRRRVDPSTDGGADLRADATALDLGYLQSKRVVAYDGADQRARPYDMLRTQVLQSMNVGGWKVLGITSPTPGCGKTLTAVNLAFSIARQPDQAVVLVDLDLQRPQVANTLALELADRGMLDLLEERTNLQNSIIPVRAGNHRVVVLPTTATRESSELMGSRTMRTILQDIRRSYQSNIIIVDLPPILASDDVISILPQMDCVLLVAAVGQSKVSEVEECSRHLKSSHLVRLVVNKATETNSNYYYYY
jgi:protein-tyrosine kinase